jgi:hypothetical protein
MFFQTILHPERLRSFKNLQQNANVLIELSVSSKQSDKSKASKLGQFDANFCRPVSVISSHPANDTYFSKLLVIPFKVLNVSYK